MSEEGAETLDKLTITELKSRPSKLQNLVGILCNLVFTIIYLGVTIFVILLAYRIYQEIRQDPMVIQPFTVPSDLEKQGYSGRTIARMLADHMDIIQKDVHKLAVHEEGARRARRREGKRQRVESVPSSKARLRATQIEDDDKKNFQEIVLPGIDLPLNFIIYVVRWLLDLEPSLMISGYVTDSKDNLYLTIGVTKKLPRVFSDNKNNLDKIIKDAALYILTVKEPLDMGLDLCSASNTIELESLIKTLREGVFSKTDQVIALILEGCVLVKENKTDLSLKKFKTALKIIPKEYKFIRSVTHIMIGDLYQDNKKYEESIKEYEESIKQDPERLETNMRLAHVFLAHGDSQKAEKIYHDSIKREENDALIYLAWGYALGDKGGSKKGIEKFNRAIKLAPDLEVAAWSYLGLGELQQEQDLEKGIEKFNQVIELLPESEVSAWAYVAWGEALIEQKKPNEAIKKYKEATELAPKAAEPYGAWGDALRIELKNLNEAKCKRPFRPFSKRFVRNGAQLGIHP